MDIRIRRTLPSLHVALIAAMLGSMVLSACTSSVSPPQARGEIGAFMLHFIILEQIGASPNYVATGGQPWAKAPPDVNLIVWAPPGNEIGGRPAAYLQSGAPLHVWWLHDDRLTEVTGDRHAAVSGYRQAYMQKPPPAAWSSPLAWSYYEFGILSLSSDNRQADVYVGFSCGPLCGSGTVYKLERNGKGQWAIRGSQMVWIS